VASVLDIQDSVNLHRAFQTGTSRPSLRCKSLVPIGPTTDNGVTSYNLPSFRLFSLRSFLLKKNRAG